MGCATRWIRSCGERGSPQRHEDTKSDHLAFVSSCLCGEIPFHDLVHRHPRPRHRRLRRGGRHQGVRGRRVLSVRPLGRRRGVHPVVHQPLSRPRHPGRHGPRPAARRGDRGRAGGRRRSRPPPGARGGSPRPHRGMDRAELRRVVRQRRRARHQRRRQHAGRRADRRRDARRLAGEPGARAARTADARHGGRRGGRRRPARQAVRRHGPDHHRGLSRPQPAGGRQPRTRCRNSAGWSASGGPSAHRVSPPSRRAPIPRVSSTSTRSRRAGSPAGSTCGSDASRPRDALADWSRVSNGHDPPDHGARELVRRG